MKRRWCSILAVLALVLCLLPITAAAAGAGTESDPWLCGPDGSESALKAVLSDGTLTIRGSGVMIDPYKASDYPWDNAREGITKLVVESGVTTIGSYAFYGFSSLTEVSLPEGLTMICMDAFEAAVSLEKVTIPSSVSQVGDLAFNGCSALSEVTFLRRTPPIIGFNAFSDCTSLQTITVPCGTGEAYKARQYLPADAIREADHTPNGNGTCTGCGFQYTVRVRTDGEESYYADIQGAFTAANAAGDATVELLADAALPEGECLTVKWGHRIHLNCGDFTLSGNSGWVIGVEKGGTLEFESGTLKNTSKFRAAVSVDGGSFIMSGGTLELESSDSIAVSIMGYVDRMATAVISSGSVGVGAKGLDIGAYTTVQLSGGTYGSINAGIGGDYASPAQKAVTVPGLLKTGYAFFKDGKPVALEPEQHYLEGPVTVAECPHIWEYTQTEGAETHQKVCPACGDGKDAAAESCTFETWTDTGDGTTHKGVCVCGRGKTEEHSWEYSAGQTGKVSTISRTCGSCGRSETVGTLTISEDLRLTFGQTAGRKVEVTPDPKTLELSNIKWFKDDAESLGEKGLTYDLSIQNVDMARFKFTASCHGCAIELTADVTVDPAPLPEDKIHVEEGPFTFSNKQIRPAVTVDGLIQDKDYTVEYKDNISAGTASIVLTGMRNYTGTVTKTFEIEKAALTFDGTLTASELTYGTPLSEAEITPIGALQLDGADIPGTWKIESTDTPDAGQHTCKAVFTPADETVAASCEPLTREVTVTVTKAHYKISVGIQIQAGRTLEYDLAAGLSDNAVLPEGLLSDTEWSAEHREDKDDNHILAKTPEAAGGKLTIQIKDTATVGQTAFVEFDLNSKNWYAGLTCRIAVVDKFTPEITAPALQHTYDGKAPDLAAAISQMTAEYNGEPVPGTFTFKAPESAPVHVRESGAMTVVFTPEDTETYAEAEKSLYVLIRPATVTVTAPSPTVKKGDPMPPLTPEITGLAEGEELKTPPVVTCEAQDTGTEGEFPIIVSGAEVPNTDDYNREIVYVPGKLTVTPASGGGGGGGGGPVNPPVDPDPDNPDPPPVDPDPDNPDPPPVDPDPDNPDPPPVDPDDLEIKLELEEGIQEVPPALRELEHLNTPEKLIHAMRLLLTEAGLPEGNMVVYDAALMVSMDGGKTWVPAAPGNFPAGGLRVTLPYPEGTGADYRFTVAHMFTSAALGKTPGDTEVFGPDEVENAEEGIRVTLTGLSPISIGWTEPEAPPDPPAPPVDPDPPAPPADDRDDDDDDDDDRPDPPSSPSYTVEVEETDNGSVTSSRTRAPGGSAVTLTAAPKPGYRLENLTVTDSRGRVLRLTDKGAGRYGFTMPAQGDVTVNAVFVPLVGTAGNGSASGGGSTGAGTPASGCDGGADCPSRAFRDLERNGWYHEAVDFVLARGLMDGYGDGRFGPDGRLTRAQFAQILYNKEGRPAVTGGRVFSDVAPEAWCAQAVAWAAERGITGGYGGGRFGPDDPITREQLAVMLWRYAGSPASSGGALSFTDAEQASSHAREALRWAAENGVLNGYADGRLEPKGMTARIHAAQMLKNFMTWHQDL